MVRRTAARLAPLTALLAGVVGCSGISEPPEIVTLEADLLPTEGVIDPIAGTVAMVIEERQTQIGIGLRGGLEGSRFGWTVRNGSCSGTGDGIGPMSAFPSIEVDKDGDGVAETTLFRRIAVEGVYAAEVFAEPDGTRTVLACADLVPGD
jgi:hypothetical protein